MTGHREVREELGAYALGALEPRERAAVDAHLRECPECREEVARLAALPGLLARLPEEDTGGADVPPAAADLGARALATIAARRRSSRRRRRRWGAALGGGAAAAVVAVVLLVAGGGGGDDGGGDGGVALRVEPVAADAGEVTGTAWADGRDWGTAIGVDLQDLPDRPAYELTAIADDGHREVAATWSPTESGSARIEGGCAIRPADMAGYEVTAAGGEVLLRLEADWG